MMTALRVAALFAGYSVIGFGGDYAAGFLALDGSDVAVEVTRQARHVVVDVQPHVVVDVRSSVASRVQVRLGGQCDFEIDREVTIPISGVNHLNIDAGSGELRVEGRDGLREIVAVGTVCASSEDYLEQLRLTAETSAAGVVMGRRDARMGGEDAGRRIPSRPDRGSLRGRSRRARTGRIRSRGWGRAGRGRRPVSQGEPQRDRRRR